MEAPQSISIHALRAERDLANYANGIISSNFNPRAPSGARRGLICRCSFGGNISIHALRAERDSSAPQASARVPISIHALRAERDLSSNPHPLWAVYFNPRAPSGARPRGPNRRRAGLYFNPRAPSGARHGKNGNAKCGTRFQSTRSERSATGNRNYGSHNCWNFNPRAPSGARPGTVFNAGPVAVFQSTRSERSATARSCPQILFPRNFNPRAPSGARRCCLLTIGTLP